MNYRDLPQQGWGLRRSIVSDTAHYVGRFLSCLLSFTHWEWL